MVRGERWRGGSVKKARMKEEGEAGAEMWIKASPREREREREGGIYSVRALIYKPRGQTQGEGALMQFSRAGVQPAFLLLHPQRIGSIDINRGMDMMSKLLICSAS